jgi:hypothetical protein
MVLFSYDYVDSDMKFLKEMKFFTRVQPIGMSILDLAHIEIPANDQN